MEAMNVVCCFCGASFPERHAVLMAIHPPEDRDETQGLYAHKRCLASRLHPTVSHLLDLEDDIEEG